ncbi:fungal-specific transcription factor [Dactylonectria macrodidyma]|uniref:Fungal-specific transcription factor n=1 Tax=Dactylonectria macrodidyma TaxID=307937 RepID=A0A9P9DYE7_9HYPO|nr:fungal-specific transcription factor [Dactylonectria macrodidyma]
MATLRLQTVDNRVEGRLALVTGSSGGIGSACARALAAEGCDIALHYASSQLFTTVAADLSQRDSTRTLARRVLENTEVAAKHKAISILVANAGLGRRIRDIQSIEEEDWDEMLEVNTRSQFVVTKSCLPGMRSQGWGRVILIGSIASRGGGLNGCHYAASKGALCSMGLNLATLLAPEGVTVNMVLPAMIGATGMIPAPKSQTWDENCNLQSLMSTDPGLAIAGSVPVHRLGFPDEVSNVVSIDSDGLSGSPPCRRCIDERRECILAKSRRGGRRIRGMKSGQQNKTPRASHRTHDVSFVGEEDVADADNEHEDVLSHGNQGPSPALEHWQSPQVAGGWPVDDAGSMQERAPLRGSSDGFEGRITSGDLLNPSDALDLLAQVADLDTHERGGPATASGVSNSAQGMSADTIGSAAQYPPISEGILPLSQASVLVQHYHQHYHPFFPIAHGPIFDGDDVSEWIEKEEHLLTAILTVASKDDPTWALIHEACSRHMESLMSKLIYTGSTTVGAVEAMLILAEWAPQHPQENAVIGCGKEDQGSWMLVGVAIRLGYLQRLEQTGLLQEKDIQSQSFSRKRIAWAGKKPHLTVYGLSHLTPLACYMSDRQVSIRLGKGFWSRGPGPSTNLRAADFPSLRAQKLGSDDLALLFQAQLELTQLFSNAHDILYSSTSHREQLYVGGEYVRYIDDFSSVLRKWKLSWGGLSFTPHVKASLILSYDFLRLYINAFAFQATINRAMARARPTSPNTAPVIGPLFADLAAAPDARFIYESIDAANSLLGTLNSFIDPVMGLKYMPLKYYLYVIYAAVFLFKARLAGAINASDTTGMRRAIHETITRLQKTSENPQSVGHRYARSLRLLWRKLMGRSINPADTRRPSIGEPSATAASALVQPRIDCGDWAAELESLNGFSWRDLDSLGQYIANNAALSSVDGGLTSPEFNSEQGAGMDALATGFWYDNLWSGNNIIF